MTLAGVEQVVYIGATVAGIVLVALEPSHPQWQWIGGVVAGLGVVAAALRPSPAAVATITTQAQAIDSLTGRIGSLIAPDISRKGPSAT